MALLDGKLNVQQAAEYVGCSTAFIRRRAREGSLLSEKLGTRFYFEKKALDTLVTKQPHNAPNTDIT